MEGVYNMKTKAFRSLILASPLILIALTLLIGYLVIY
jgi:hypothetical protein